MAEKMTHEVLHPKLYLRVEGKLQHVEAGTELNLTKDQAKALGSKVRSLTEKKQLSSSGKNEGK